MTHLQDILDRYSKLCDYCDVFWRDCFAQLPRQECACAEGCSTCCELSSVNFLEAYRIADYCANDPFVLDNCSATGKAGPCPFLTNDRCRIYPARPLICRTHGLLLKSDDFERSITASCPFNFTSLDHDRIDEALALDIDRVTTGLAKLNIAFCMVYGAAAQANERIALRDLSSGKIGRSWFNSIRQVADNSAPSLEEAP
jgi:uncharacterized protein